MHNDRQLAGDRDLGAAHADPLGTQQTIAAFGDVPAMIDLARSVAPWGQADIGAHRSRSPKPCGIIDDGGIGEGDDNSDAGNGHQVQRGDIGARPSENLPIEDSYLHAHGMPDDEQRFDDRRQHAIADDRSRTRIANRPLAPRAMTKPKVLSSPRIVLAIVWRCETSCDRATSSIFSVCASMLLTATSRYQPVRTT